jgi:hypothetical protein
MTRRPITKTLAVVGFLGLIAAGCGGSGGGEASAEPDGTTAGTGTERSGWERVEPGGDCQCADGSEFSFWVREADPDKVLLYFRGGGACWSAEMCALDGSDGGEELYDSSARGDNPNQWDGVFDLADEDSPFADWSIVYVPYCTGDVFGGNATTEYAPGLTIQHKGYVNGTAALDYLASTFPDASDVVVAGLSAGSVAAPLYGGLASDQLPDAHVTVLADGSGAYTADAGSQIAGVWGVADAIPDWPENAGLTAEQWASPPGVRPGRSPRPGHQVRPPRLRLRP